MILMRLEKLYKSFFPLKQYLVLRVIGIIILFLATNNAFAIDQVGLYDIWEMQVTNSKTYSNPFNYNVIELQATFNSPSGRQINFFGFYDGDGNGGQTGNIWKLRFMPDEIGTWTYSFSWTDGTSGNSGSFVVVDNGLPGPLKVASDNSWYFETARGIPFDFRGCGFMFWHWDFSLGKFKSFIDELENYKAAIQSDINSEGCNFIYTWNSADRISRYNSVDESWWIDQTEAGKKVFNLAVFEAWDDLLTFLKEQKVYAMPWAVFSLQDDFYAFNDYKVFLRYWVARMAPYYNWLGWSLTWEWPEKLSESQVSQIMNQVKDWNPFPTLQTAHDSSRSSFTSWMSFSSRQRETRNVYIGNSRSAGQHGGVQGPFINMPIIGAEDIWEEATGSYGQCRNETEVLRGAWGEMLAGVMPLYTEWSNNSDLSWGKGEGKDDVKRMFDFFYSKTHYRQYKQLNNLVSKSERQICSGISGQEYLVYDENGGSIKLNLTNTNSSDKFLITWFDPTNGKEQNGGSINGGGSITLASPFGSDTVLLLKRTDSTPPAAPEGLHRKTK